jgi:hypothetical protein
VITLEIQRIRTPPMLMLYATYLYLAGMGFSNPPGGGGVEQPWCEEELRGY